MRTARQLLLIIALLIGVAAVAEAQQGRRRGGDRGMNPTAMLLQDIELTAEQKARVDTITANYRVTMQASRERMRAGILPDSASRAEMQKMRAALQADLRAVLTPEQEVVFDRNIAGLAQRQQRRPPPTRSR